MPILRIWCVALLAVCCALATQAQEGATETRTVYLGAALLDLDDGAMPTQTAIVVRGERIEAVLDAANYLPAKDVRIVDVQGTYVLPGFIDSHVHLATPPDRGIALAMLRRNLYGGVTAVRDMGDDARFMAGLAYGARFGEYPAPDIHFTALFAGPGFFSDPRVQASSKGETAGRVPWMREINPKTDLIEAIAQAKGTGAAAVKVYANLAAAAVAGIVAEAKRQGMPVWAHGAVFPASPLEVVQAGADTVSHACMLAYQAQAMPQTYHHRADVEEDRFSPGMPAALEAVFDEMKRRGTLLDATLLVYVTIERMRAEFPPGQGPPIYCSADLAGRITKAAHAAGVDVAAGTDAPGRADDPYPALQQEMALLVTQAGMTPLQALRSATLIGARSLGLESEMGTIAPGKLANLVFLSADPSKDIAASRSVVLTVKRGQDFWRRDFVMPTPEAFGEMP